MSVVLRPYHSNGKLHNEVFIDDNLVGHIISEDETVRFYPQRDTYFSWTELVVISRHMLPQFD